MNSYIGPDVVISYIGSDVVNSYIGSYVVSSYIRSDVVNSYIGSDVVNSYIGSNVVNSYIVSDKFVLQTSIMTFLCSKIHAGNCFNDIYAIIHQDIRMISTQMSDKTHFYVNENVEIIVSAHNALLE